MRRLYIPSPIFRIALRDKTQETTDGATVLLVEQGDLMPNLWGVVRKGVDRIIHANGVTGGGVP